MKNYCSLKINNRPIKGKKNIHFSVLGDSLFQQKGVPVFSCPIMVTFNLYTFTENVRNSP